MYLCRIGCQFIQLLLLLLRPCRSSSGPSPTISPGGLELDSVRVRASIRALVVRPHEPPGQSKAVSIQERPLSFYLKSGKLGPVDMFERVLDETMSASSA